MKTKLQPMVAEFVKEKLPLMVAEIDSEKLAPLVREISGVEAKMDDFEVKEKSWLRLPVVAASSEYLVMGYLMRRNILTYKAPQNNEGYDLICIHPDPRHIPQKKELSQVRVQVKSRYATDCDRGFPVKETSFEAFDFLVVAFLNIGNFYGKYDGSIGAKDIEFYTLPRDFIRKHHNKTSSWQKVRLKPLGKEIEQYKNDKGFEQIAELLGILKPVKKK